MRDFGGCKNCPRRKTSNVAVRTQIELITTIFGPGEVSEIWITFPDPQIKCKRAKHRLVHPSFLQRYKQILKPEGCIHLKTDSEFLHGYTLGLLQEQPERILYAHHDIYNNPHAPEEATALQTFYEQQFLEQGKAITYIKFQWQ